MRCLINYIRQCFCKHELKFEEIKWNGIDSETRQLVENNIKVSRTCTRCGWHKSYFKF